jgi:DNA polymerase elongation subunit (family B)
MDFYTSVFQRGNKIYARGYENGKRVSEIVNYSPYLFIKKPGGKFRTLDDEAVEKITFDNISEAKDFVSRYEDVSNMAIYGLDNFAYTYIFDNFKGEINYDPNIIRSITIDIECAADEGFPDIGQADKEITAITMRYKGAAYVFGCGNFKPTDQNIFYMKCRDEATLLTKFIQAWKEIDPDIVTGWNIEFFDIPYLFNRIKRVLSFEDVKKFSPWGIVVEKEIDFRNKKNQSYTPMGVSVLDYYQLYRKFTFGNQESYKLDFIAELELDEHKIDYSEYGNLLELYKNNYQKFIEYNIHDCVLVDRLDEKLKFIEQVMAFAYDAKVNYIDTMTTVRPWDVIIHNYLLERGIVIPKFKKQSDDEELVGGFVKEPKIGLSEWVVSLDLNSLYPHLIMQYNISPECFRGRISEFPSVDDIIGGEYINNSEYSIAANGCKFTKEFQGFLPALMEKMYNDRVEYKSKMIEAKKRYEKTKDPEETKLIARYHNMQLAKKIQLNSAYGALGNPYFRWFNHNYAEAITLSGQLSIRWIAEKINQYLNTILKTKNTDYVIASDTDSIYVELKKLVEISGVTDKNKIVDMIDKFCELKIEPYIDNCYQELADIMRAYQQKMKMKRETIADKGIWRGKKMYILNAWDVEGVRYEKPKLKMSGIEAVRSSTPQACRKSIKSAFEIVMNKDKETLIKYIEDFRNEFMNLPFEKVSFPRGVKGLEKYKDRSTIYKKGCPIHVKGSLLFNHWLEKNNIKHIQPIQNGDKIRFAYLKVPNPIQATVIAAPDELPDEFNLGKYIDRDTQFEKSFLEPVKSITSIIGWEVEKRATLEDFLS